MSLAARPRERSEKGPAREVQPRGGRLMDFAFSAAVAAAFDVAGRFSRLSPFFFPRSSFLFLPKKTNSNNSQGRNIRPKTEAAAPVAEVAVPRRGEWIRRERKESQREQRERES